MPGFAAANAWQSLLASGKSQFRRIGNKLARSLHLRKPAGPYPYAQDILAGMDGWRICCIRT